MELRIKSIIFLFKTGNILAVPLKVDLQQIKEADVHLMRNTKLAQCNIFFFKTQGRKLILISFKI